MIYAEGVEQISPGQRPHRYPHFSCAGPSEPSRLFNLRSDIGERQDLAEQHPSVLQDLQAEWKRWNAELPEPIFPARPIRQKKL